MSTIEIAALKKDYEDIKHEVAGVKQGVNNLQNSMRRIEACLISDEEMGRVGLVERLEFLNKKVTDIDKHVKQIQHLTAIEAAKKTIWAMVFGAIGAVALYFGKLIIENFVK